MQAHNAAPALNAERRADILERACRYSRYIRRLVTAESDLGQRAKFGRPWNAGLMSARLGELMDAGAGLERSLRQLRNEVMLVIIARDMAGLADLTEVVSTSTALAETALQAATAHI